MKKAEDNKWRNDYPAALQQQGIIFRTLRLSLSWKRVLLRLTITDNGWAFVYIPANLFSLSRHCPEVFI